MQSVWTHWIDHSLPFDLSWRNLIWGPGPRVISFTLNTCINSLPTPDMLHLMGISEVGMCSLCGAKQCTLFHILVGCNKALTDKRYTWRHDSVLATVLQLMVPLLIRHNNSTPNNKPSPITFIAAGTVPKTDPVKPHRLWEKCLFRKPCCRIIFPILRLYNMAS